MINVCINIKTDSHNIGKSQNNHKYRFKALLTVKLISQMIEKTALQAGFNVWKKKHKVKIYIEPRNASSQVFETENQSRKSKKILETLAGLNFLL